jgi:KaiC/GvpD/RAD55 family RecA-like ATPase
MHRYFLGLKELDDAIGGIDGGTNIMLIGPPMCGKGAILNSIMAAGLRSDEAVILVETRLPGRDALQKLKPPVGARVGVVDCVTRALGVNATDTAGVRHISSPVDLTGVGVRVSQFTDEFGRAEADGLRLGIDSLSTMLMYSSLQTVYRFMHVIAGRIAMQHNLGVYVVDEDMHDAQTVATLKQLFNAVLQAKNEGDHTFVRAIGLTPQPTPWFEYEARDHMALIRRPADD